MEAVFRRGSVCTLCALLLFHSATLRPFCNSDGLGERPAELPLRLVVKLKADRQPKSRQPGSGLQAVGVADFDRLNESLAIQPQSHLLWPAIGTARAGNLANVFVLSVAEGADLEKMLDEYRRLASVEYAEPDYRLTLFSTPNDSLYSYQWSLDNTGQGYYDVVSHPGPGNDELTIEHGMPDADIDANEVFLTPPDHTATVIVAIIDTGVDMGHPDLQDNLWTNDREIPGNGLDDDHNGYTDDVRGWDFCGNERSLPFFQDNDPTDTHGHGTHCAGIVAASASNFKGISGIASDCRIMALKFGPLLTVSGAAEAIVYAADNGADVINMSWGSFFESRLLKDALAYARAKGVILCAAAGNSGSDWLVYPAAYPSTIAVGATNSSDHLATFSSFGNHLDVSAPGMSVLSLRAHGTDMYAAPGIQEPEPWVHVVQGSYYVASGTSMAAPHVAGVAAYLRSVSPGIVPDRAQQIIQLSADDIVDPYGKGWNYVGWDKYTGYGRVNLERALMLAPRIRAKIDFPRFSNVLTGTVPISGFADGVDFSSWNLEYGQGGNPSAWTPITSSASRVSGGKLVDWGAGNLNGEYTIRLRVGEFNIDYVTLFIVNRTLATVITPHDGDTVCASAEVIVNAFCPGFDRAILGYKADGSAGGWTAIDTSTRPLFSETFISWNTGSLPDGVYTLRLTVYAQNGPQSADSVTVVVRSPFSGERGWRVKLDTTAAIIPTYGDFDGDQSNEILVGTATGLKAFATDGSPKPSLISQFPPNDFRVPVAVGNLDGDGIDDFVAVGASPPTLFVYRSRGQVVQIPLSEAPCVYRYYSGTRESLFPQLFLKDINHDGRDEIFYWAGSTGAEGGISTYVYNADGSIRSCGGVIATLSQLLSADLDGDLIDEYYFLDPSGNLCQLDTCGNLLQTCSLNSGGAVFQLRGMSAVDFNGDGRLELMVMGFFDFHSPTDYHLLLPLDYNLQLVKGGARNLGVTSYFAPTAPVFGDIDGNGSLEYLIAWYDERQSYVYAWHADSRPLVGDSLGSGLFAVTSRPGIATMPILANVGSDSGSEIIVSTGSDLFLTYEKQNLYAWDGFAQSLTGWPLLVSDDLRGHTSMMVSPVVGDIDGDGDVDLMITTASGELVFTSFEDVPFDPRYAPCPMWRYNRRLNGVASDLVAPPTDIDDRDEPVPSPKFSVMQNYPNPFNLSTTIEFSLDRPLDVEFQVYNVLGQRVIAEHLGRQSAGHHVLVWEGHDKSGAELPSGVYIYSLRAGQHVVTKKMLLVK